MKKNLIYLLGFFVLIFSACEDQEDLITADAKEGGLMSVETPLVNYVVGDDKDYNVELLVFQSSDVTTDKINVHSKFSGVKRDVNGVPILDDNGLTIPISSNDVIIKTIDIADKKSHLVSFSVKFADLIRDIVYDGGPLSTDDSNLNIGDVWEFSFEGVTNEGNSTMNATTAKIAVSTRFAGIYTVKESIYWHPAGGDQGGWNGGQMVIESVDAVTYHILGNGPFSLGQNPDNEFYFTVDPGTGAITIPKEYAGATQTVWGGDEVANCDDNAALLPNVNCGSTNFTVKDDVNGKDQVVMSHGYIRASGTREFYYVLEKN